MTAFDLIAQRAVFAALNGKINARVVDDPLPLPTGRPDSDFPYVVIGDATERPWDTDDTLGSEVTVTLHIWSRKPSYTEAKDIAAAISGLMHRKSISAPGARIIDCLREFANFMRDDDGKTRHGAVRYRLTMQEL